VRLTMESGKCIGIDRFLPSELNLCILRQLRAVELVIACCASSTWARLVRYERVWQLACEHRWPEAFAGCFCRLSRAASVPAPIYMPSWVLPCMSRLHLSYVPGQYDVQLARAPSTSSCQAAWRIFYMEHDAYELMNIAHDDTLRGEEDQRPQIAEAQVELCCLCDSLRMLAAAGVPSPLRALAANNLKAMDAVSILGRELSVHRLRLGQPLHGDQSKTWEQEQKALQALQSVVSPENLSPLVVPTQVVASSSIRNTEAAASVGVATSGEAPPSSELENEPTRPCELRSLCVTDFRISARFIRQILATLRASTSRLQQLDLSHSPLQHEGAALLAVELHPERALPCLAFLGLASCQLRDEGLSYLVDGMSGYAPLRALDIAHNQIGVAGAEVLGQMLLPLLELPPEATDDLDELDDEEDREAAEDDEDDIDIEPANDDFDDPAGNTVVAAAVAIAAATGEMGYISTASEAVAAIKAEEELMDVDSSAIGAAVTVAAATGGCSTDATVAVAPADTSVPPDVASPPDPPPPRARSATIRARKVRRGSGSRLTTLEVSYNPLGEAGLSYLAAGMRRSPHLREFGCRYVNREPRETDGRLEAFPLTPLLRNQTATSVDLSYNFIAASLHSSVDDLREALAANSAIKSLSLRRCCIGGWRRARAIARGLGRNTTLTSVDLGYNGLGAAAQPGSSQQLGAIAISWLSGGAAAWLNSGGLNGAGGGRPPLPRLSLAVDAICEAIRDNRTLRFLGLAHNTLGDLGAVAIVGPALSSPSLTALDLRSNDLSFAALNTITAKLQASSVLWQPAAPLQPTPAGSPPHWPFLCTMPDTVVGAHDAMHHPGSSSSTAAIAPSKGVVADFDRNHRRSLIFVDLRSNGLDEFLTPPEQPIRGDTYSAESGVSGANAPVSHIPAAVLPSGQQLAVPTPTVKIPAPPPNSSAPSAAVAVPAPLPSVTWAPTRLHEAVHQIRLGCDTEQVDGVNGALPGEEDYPRERSRQSEGNATVDAPLEAADRKPCVVVNGSVVGVTGGPSAEGDQSSPAEPVNAAYAAAASATPTAASALWARSAEGPSELSVIASALAGLPASSYALWPLEAGLGKRQTARRLCPYYMNRQVELNTHMRKILVEWLNEVSTA